MAFSPGSSGRLTDRDLDRFPDDSLFHRIARAVCHAGCLPRKELYETWEVARRVRRLFRGGRVIDVAGGHGLLAHVMLLLDDSSPRALVIDTNVPASSGRLREVLVAAWPRLEGRVELITGTVEEADIVATDVVVSSHACGTLTDRLLERAVSARARVAVLPCCHDLARSDSGDLTGWLDGPLAIDVVRAERLRQSGYRIWTQTIPAAITPKNRLLLGRPALSGTGEGQDSRVEGPALRSSNPTRTSARCCGERPTCMPRPKPSRISSRRTRDCRRAPTSCSSRTCGCR